MKVDWKKFIKPAMAVIAALATLYAVISMVQLHGLGAYRIGTEAGAVFVASYGWVLTAAILLWIVLLVLFVRQKLLNGGLEKLQEMQKNRRRARRAKEKAKKAEENRSAAEKDSAVDAEVKPGYSRKRIQAEKRDSAENQEPEKKGQGKPAAQEKSAAQGKPAPKKEAAPAPKKESKPAPQDRQSEWLAKPSGEKSEYPVLSEEDGLENSLLGKVPGVKNLLEKKRDRLYDQDAEDQDAPAAPEEKAPAPERAPAPAEPSEESSESPAQGDDVPEVPMEKVCPNCGALLRPGAKFCVSCGKRLGE